jgi:hypothetical protein
MELESEGKMERTCAYCKHHIWADGLSYHICNLDEDDESCETTGTCERFMDSGKYKD